MTHRMMGVDGEVPACQPPTSAPSPHGATVDAVQCGDVGCAGAMCTAGWCKCARGSCSGVVGAHRLKVRLWAHARRGRRETLDSRPSRRRPWNWACRKNFGGGPAPCPTQGGGSSRGMYSTGCHPTLLTLGKTGGVTNITSDTYAQLVGSSSPPQAKKFPSGVLISGHNIYRPRMTK